MKTADRKGMNARTRTVPLRIRGGLARGLTKRVFDVCLAALGLLVVSPFCLYVAIRLKRESPGPLLYRGKRVGKDGKVFEILKFRTMHERPESYEGARITAHDDDRITSVGRFLRDTKLNELPQLWNVLKGEMSLVGPRPEDPEFVAGWPAHLRAEILSVRPGITSPASVTYHDEEKRLSRDNLMHDYLETILPDKLRMDSLYVRHHTLLADIDTIFWTIVILFPRLGGNKVSEGWLYGGPFVRFKRDFLNWLVTDFLVAFGAIAVTGLLWRLLAGPLDVGVGPAAFMGAVLAVYITIFNAVLGLKGVSWSRPAAEDVLKLIAACLLAAGAFVFTYRFFPHLPALPTEFVLTATVAVLAGFVVVRYRLRLVTGLADRWTRSRRSGLSLGERVLIVGAGVGGEFVTWVLSRPDFRKNFVVVGFVDDDPRKQGVRFDGIGVLGTTGDIGALVAKHDVGLIFYAISKISTHDNARILSLCQKTGVPVVNIADVIENLRQQITVNPTARAVASSGDPP
jgi:lipopolysaccharide/colanic/teichoic acid biosynthesis glycosyltransferase